MSVAPHIFRRALRSLWENLYLNSVSTAVIASALVLMGMYLTVQHNINIAVTSWSRDVHVSAYFQPEVPEADREALRDSIARDPNVVRVKYVTEEDARVWLRSRVDGLDDVLEDLGPGVLPASLEITLRESGDLNSQMTGLAPWLRPEEFAEVDYGREWLERFEALLSVVKGIGATMGLLVLVAALFLVANTVHLAIYNRRDELEIQKLVGATTGYIVAPFIVEGFAHGLLGSLIAIVCLWGIHTGLAGRLEAALQLGLIPEFGFLPLSWVLALMLCGMVLGIGAASVAVTRFIATAP